MLDNPVTETETTGFHMFLWRDVAAIANLPEDAFISKQLKKTVLSDFPSVLRKDLGKFSYQHAAFGNFHALSEFRVGRVLFYLRFKRLPLVLFIFESLEDFKCVLRLGNQFKKFLACGVDAVFAYRREDFFSYPLLELLCLRLSGAENQRVKPGFVDDWYLLRTSRGVDSIYTPFVVIQYLFESIAGVVDFQGLTDILGDKPRIVVDDDCPDRTAKRGIVEWYYVVVHVVYRLKVLVWFGCVLLSVASWAKMRRVWIMASLSGKLSLTERAITDPLALGDSASFWIGTWMVSIMGVWWFGWLMRQNYQQLLNKSINISAYRYYFRLAIISRCW